jgi:multicomponent K+:H+ antiporter subunit E
MLRLFPVPLLSLALAALWLVLNRSYGPSALGCWRRLLAVAIPLLTRSLRPTPVRFRRPLTALRLFFWWWDTT